MLFRGAVMGRPVRAQLEGWLVGKRHWQTGSPLSLTHAANPRMKREQVFPAPFSFPFLWYFFFSFETKPYFSYCLAYAVISIFFVLCFHRHPTWLFLLWKEGRCLPRKDRGLLPVSKGIQNPRTKGPTRQQSDSERKIKREGMAVRENGIYRQAGPKRTHSWKRQIVKITKMSECIGGKKLGWIFPSNFDKGWDVSCITYEHRDYVRFTFWSTWGQEWKTQPEDRIWSKEKWTLGRDSEALYSSPGSAANTSLPKHITYHP